MLFMSNIDKNNANIDGVTKLLVTLIMIAWMNILFEIIYMDVFGQSEEGIIKIVISLVCTVWLISAAIMTSIIKDRRNRKMGWVKYFKGNVWITWIGSGAFIVGLICATYGAYTIYGKGIDSGIYAMGVLALALILTTSSIGLGAINALKKYNAERGK
ncbi:hypothetical protein A3715_11415 [Oleiphilus sp. HI0009]|nr:hypothetical protein A3715_11415 [Oleiphilus sp. HI0009]